jgi:hypothetical protein
MAGRYLVTLTAAGIDVTADSTQQAERYGLEDARQFRAAWTYCATEIEPTAEEPAESFEDVEIDLHLNSRRGRGRDAVFNWDALFVLAVEAESEEAAPAAAIEFLKAS